MAERDSMLTQVSTEEHGAVLQAPNALMFGGASCLLLFERIPVRYVVLYNPLWSRLTSHGRRVRELQCRPRLVGDCPLQRSWYQWLVAANQNLRSELELKIVKIALGRSRVGS